MEENKQIHEAGKAKHLTTTETTTDVIDLPCNQSITISQRVGCGHVYLLIETRHGKFDKLTIKGTMAKSCDCGESFLQSIGKILTFSVRRALKEGTMEEGILNHLKGHRCNIPIYKGSLSCVDGIAKGMKKYFDNYELPTRKTN